MVTVIVNDASSILNEIDAHAFISDAHFGIEISLHASISCARPSRLRGCSPCTRRSCSLLLLVLSCERLQVPGICTTFQILKMPSYSLCSNRFVPQTSPPSFCFTSSCHQHGTLGLRLWTKNLPSNTLCSHMFGSHHIPDVFFSDPVAQHKDKPFFLCPYRHACTFYSSTCTWQHVLKPFHHQLQFYRLRLLPSPQPEDHRLPWYFHTPIFNRWTLIRLIRMMQKRKKQASGFLNCGCFHQWRHLRPGRRFAGSYALQ